MDPVVIIGSGYAGYSVAREFRRRNKEAQLLVLTADEGQFYSKPSLSEALSQGITPEALVNKTAQQMAAQIKGEVRTAVRVQALDPATRQIVLDRETIAYSQLVLALGADPLHLPLTNGTQRRVLSVNDLADYRRFVAAIAGKKSITILGAGLIGCEFANDLSQAGYQVDVIDLAAHPLSRLLPPENGHYLRNALQQRGVRWHLGTGVTAIELQGHSVLIRCENGEELITDLVLSAIGLKPRTALAQAAGLAIHRGIVVDRQLRTSDPHIFALGDCAEVAGQWLPYIAPISLAAKVVATNLAGGEASACYPAMPVIVKTPACPTVVCPPAQEEPGEWTTECDTDGMQSLFRGGAGALRGFALQGSRAAQAPTLAPQLPMLFG